SRSSTACSAPSERPLLETVAATCSSLQVNPHLATSRLPTDTEAQGHRKEQCCVRTGRRVRIDELGGQLCIHALGTSNNEMSRSAAHEHGEARYRSASGRFARAVSVASSAFRSRPAS